MDPITEGVIAGLLTEGLLALFAAARQGPTRPIAPADLRSLLQPPATALARAVAQGGAGQSERVTRFLVSQEVETLLRKIFTGRHAEGDAASLTALEREFVALYGFIVGGEHAATDAPPLFRLLVDACDTALRLAVERGLPSALDARAVLRHHDLAARLTAIEQNIAFLRTEAPADPATIETFVGEYLSQAQNRFGYLIPQISDVGTRADGEHLYAFTHRTFLEYFTAAYLARNCASAEELAERLLPRVRDGQWDVVAQLACHIKEQAQAGSADAILRHFIDAARNIASPEAKFRLYGFMARCLAFLVPRPVIRREIVTEFLEFWVGLVAEIPMSVGKNELLTIPGPDSGETIYRLLFDSAPENCSTVVPAIQDTLITLLSRDLNTGIPLAATELILVSGLAGIATRPGLSDPDLLPNITWHDFLLRQKDTLLGFASSYPKIAVFVADHFPDWSWPNVFENYGLPPLITGHDSRFISGQYFLPLELRFLVIGGTRTQETCSLVSSLRTDHGNTSTVGLKPRASPAFRIIDI